MLMINHNILEITGYFCTLLIGLSLGLIGAGGSILTIPILIYLFKLSPKEALPLSLLVVALSSIVASYQHWKNKNIEIKIALNFIIFSSLGAFVGGLLSRFLPDKLQLTIFISLMFMGSFYMLLKKPEEKNKKVETKGFLLVTVVAIIIGLLTGLIGIGGGFMIIPSLMALLNFPIKKAIGTSLFIISINSICGFIGNAGHEEINWKFTFLFILISSLGGLIGSHFNNIVQPEVLKKVLAFLLIALALFMIFKELI